MEIPKTTEVEMKVAALSSAMASVLASIYCENALLRSILKERGLLSDEHWMTEIKKFSEAKWKSFESEIQAKIQEQSKRVLDRMMKGRVQ